MSRVRLSDETIAARMVELRNLRMLHARDRQQILQLKAENKQLKAENRELRHLLVAAQAQIATQAVQIAELQTMVFGKKHKQPPTGTVVPVPATLPVPPRPSASYRRPIPPATAVTSEESVPLPKYCSCGGSLTNVSLHDRSTGLELEPYHP